MSQKFNLYCVKCHKTVDTYDVSEAPMDNILKGKKYFYMEKIARCPVCGSEIFVPEIEKYNRDMAYAAYRRDNGIIGIDEIRKLPETLQISASDLSKVLGWDVNQYSRYCEGYIPTKEKSEILESLVEFPDKFKDYLEEYRRNHPSDPLEKDKNKAE